MTECPETRKASQYHDGELEESQRSLFEEHLQNCSACQTALSEYASLTNVCRFDGASQFASEVERRVYLRTLYEGLEGGLTQTRERFAYPLFAAAAMLLVSTLTFSAVMLRSPRNLDEVAMHWAEYMVNEPISINPDLEVDAGAEENLTEWMIYALSEDSVND